ncbi:FkbM family methyltransferase [uncultured Rhodoblastus sp.]|uniref:FkbM family methyltransferase n=1 Tax=uncultured Rhodoblastus sp. TaxID=543037 RepID=UPI0025D86451|nr:FkbM family methyltransferase [uncultured Rhodoblastus sp.]
MSRIIETAANVAGTLRKLAMGVPGEKQGGYSRWMNVASALQFLIGRKLGFPGTPALTLGCNGKIHSWTLVERSDLTVLEEVFLNQEYALDGVAPDVVFDLGANIGVSAIFFAHRWPEARIFAIEPSPGTFKRLQVNTAMYPNITCINCAVSGADGVADFVISPNHISSSLFRKLEGASTVPVEVRSFASLLRQVGVDHVDVVKFDVEGAEDAFFLDPSPIRDVSALIGEIHKDLLNCSLGEFLGRFSEFEIETRVDGPVHMVVAATRRTR